MKLLIYLVAVSFVFVSACQNKKKETKKQKNAEAMDAFSQAAEENRRDLIKKMDENGLLETDPKQMDKMVEAVNKLQKSSSGESAKGVKALQIFVLDVQKDMKSLAKYQDGLEEAMDYSKIKKVEDIDQLTEKVKLYEKVNNELIKKINGGWYETLKKTLAAEGLEANFQKGFMQGARHGLDPKLPLLLIIRKTDDELCQAIMTQHQILKKDWGKWEWDTKEEMLNFENDSSIDAFNQTIDTILSAAKKQGEAQKKVLMMK